MTDSVVYNYRQLSVAVGNQALVQYGNGSADIAVGYRAGCQRYYFEFGSDDPVIDFNNTISIGWGA